MLLGGFIVVPLSMVRVNTIQYQFLGKNVFGILLCVSILVD